MNKNYYIETYGCQMNVYDSELVSGQLNSLGYKKTNSSHYSTLNIEDGYVKNINFKGEVNYDLEYIGVCGIKDHKLFYKLLHILLLF